MEAVRRDRLHLAELEEVAARITERAGETLLERYRRPVLLDFKDEKRTDPVTEADRAVEQMVTEELRSRFPDHGILGEEGTSEAAEAEYLWVLDPLDGTANFAGHLPFFGVSLGLLRNGVPVVGCLFVPFGPQLSAAVLRCSWGNGARAGGEPLRLEPRPFQPAGPAALPPGYFWMFKLAGDLARRPGELRNLGSICAEIATVATGGFQYAAFARPRIWDVAAGALLVREAGGLALTWHAGSWRSLERFVAPSPARGGKPTTLRDWARPVLVGAPAISQAVVPNFSMRTPPPRALVWALGRRGAMRRWLTHARARGKASVPTDRPAATPAQ